MNGLLASCNRKDLGATIWKRKRGKAKRRNKVGMRAEEKRARLSKWIRSAAHDQRDVVDDDDAGAERRLAAGSSGIDGKLPTARRIAPAVRPADRATSRCALMEDLA